MDISGFAFTVVVKGTVLRLAVDTDFRTAAAGGIKNYLLEIMVSMRAKPQKTKFQEVIYYASIKLFR